MITLSAPIVTSSPIATPSWMRTCPRMSHERPRIAPSISDLRRCVDHGTRRARALAQRHTVREHRVRADARSRRDATVVPDVRRALDLLEVADLHALTEPDVPADANPGNVEPDVLFKRIEVRRPELVEVADVLPVAVHHVAVHRPAHLEQVREELLREVVRTIRRHVLQHFGLEHVDARVDRVREHLAPRRLLEEPFDPSIVVCDDAPELERIVDRLEPDRDGRSLLLVEGNELREVDVAERIAGDDEERLVELLRGQPDGARGAERRLFDRVADLHSERLSLAEVV